MLTLSNRPKSKSQKRQNGKSKAVVYVSPSALQYTGPARLPKEAQQNDCVVVQINNTGQVASSASGVINTVFDGYLQASTPADWANYISLYTEYRVLSMEVELIPWNKYNQPTTNVLAPLYTVSDRASGSTLASAASAVSYGSCQAHEPSTRLMRTIKMAGSGEADWIAVGASPPTDDRLYIKLYGAGNSNSLTLYDFFAKCLVQFRGRQ